MDDDLRDDMEGGGSPDKKGFPMIVIFIIAAVVLGVGGFFAGQMLSGGNEKEKAPIQESKDNVAGENQKDSKKNDKSANENAEPESGDEGQEQEVVELKSKSKSGLMILDPFTVNLNDPFGRRYAEVVMNLEIAQKEMVTQINENELVKPKLRDEIFMIISSKSYNELKSTSGKVTLKEEILMRVNEILKEEFGVEPVTGVYFTKFLIQ